MVEGDSTRADTKLLAAEQWVYRCEPECACLLPAGRVFRFRICLAAYCLFVVFARIVQLLVLQMNEVAMVGGS